MSYPKVPRVQRIDLRKRVYLVTRADVEPWDVDRAWQVVTVVSRPNRSDRVDAAHVGFYASEAEARMEAARCAAEDPDGKVSR